MRRNARTRTSLGTFTCLLVLIVAAGCGPGSHEPLAALPSATLSFGPPAVGPGDLKATRQAASKAPQWAWQGYRPWKYIVVHHSASEGGNAEVFDRGHRERGFDELGYHFVITNGNGGADGRIEVGRRWRIQKWGSHTGRTPGNEYNNYGIGICLVGDFQSKMPSEKQRAALAELVDYLAERFGIPAANVIGHCDAPGTVTACPGEKLHAYLHSGFRRRTRSLARGAFQP